MSRSAVAYDFHGVRLTIRSDDPLIPQLLAPRLRRFAGERTDGADIAFDYTYAGADHVRRLPPVTARSVYDTPVGTVLFDDASDRLFMDYEGVLSSISELGRGAVSTILTAPSVDACWLASHPFFTLALLEQLKRKHVYGLHAALLARNGRAVIIPGSSGAGKSTLTLSLLRAGFSFGGDDLCFLVRRSGAMRVLAFPDEIDVTGNTVDFFPELRFLQTRQRRPGAMKWPLLPEEVYPVDFVQECEPSTLVFPRIGRADRSTLEPMDAAEALLELVPNVLLTEAQTSQAHLDALGELIRRSQCWRLTTGRDFDRIPDLLRDSMQPGTQAATDHGDATPPRDPVHL